MPYITQLDRGALTERPPEVPGELNYLISALCSRFAELHGPSYTTYNEIVGVLECAKLEFYRRLVAAYEERKRIENGDVYHGNA